MSQWPIDLPIFLSRITPAKKSAPQTKSSLSAFQVEMRKGPYNVHVLFARGARAHIGVAFEQEGPPRENGKVFVIPRDRVPLVANVRVAQPVGLNPALDAGGPTS